jgi:hypothetical protein
MATIDRRGFVAGCLAVTVAGCSEANNANKTSKPRTCGSPQTGVSFLFPPNGCWTQVGRAQVYVI